MPSGSLGNRRTVIPIKGFADEEYARGCLQYYNEQFMVKFADFGGHVCTYDVCKILWTL